VNFWTLVAIGVGPLLSGLAAVYGEYNRRHILKLRQEVNGQSHVLVAAAHKLGVTEGLQQAQADAFERGDTRGAP
jgi:hypothetical protein